MTLHRICYDREDILQYKNSSFCDIEIINKGLLDELSVTNSSTRHYNGLLYNSKPTRRGRRAGRRYKRENPISDVIPDQQVHTGVKNAQPRNQPAFLPTILYTNCRSLTQWKLEELAIYAELHKPDLKPDLIPGGSLSSECP